jgi:hypothetical protein
MTPFLAASARKKSPADMRGFSLKIYLVVDSPTPVVAGLVGFLSVIPFEVPVVPRSIEPDAFMPDAPVPAGFSPGPGVPAGPFMLEPVPIEPLDVEL